jgi:hypothetical protein
VWQWKTEEDVIDKIPENKVKDTSLLLIRMADIMFKILESVNDMLNKSRVMDSVKMWGLNGEWRDIDKIHRKF